MEQGWLERWGRGWPRIWSSGEMVISPNLQTPALRPALSLPSVPLFHIAALYQCWDLVLPLVTQQLKMSERPSRLRVWLCVVIKSWLRARTCKLLNWQNWRDGNLQPRDGTLHIQDGGRRLWRTSQASSTAGETVTWNSCLDLSFFFSYSLLLCNYNYKSFCSLIILWPLQTF